MSYIREKTIAGLKLGDSFTVSRTFTEQDTTAFAELSRDYNPVHFDDRFSSTKDFQGRICHGLLVASLLTEIGGQIGWLASGMNFRFKKPVYFGDMIECRFSITELDDRNRAKAEAVFKNQRNEVVIEAYVTGIVPGSREKRVMQAMMAEADQTNKCRGNLSIDGDGRETGKVIAYIRGNDLLCRACKRLLWNALDACRSGFEWLDLRRPACRRDRN